MLYMLHSHYDMNLGPLPNWDQIWTYQNTAASPLIVSWNSTWRKYTSFLLWRCGAANGKSFFLVFFTRFCPPTFQLLFNIWLWAYESGLFWKLLFLKLPPQVSSFEQKWNRHIVNFQDLSNYPLSQFSSFCSISRTVNQKFLPHVFHPHHPCGLKLGLSKDAFPSNAKVRHACPEG